MALPIQMSKLPPGPVISPYDATSGQMLADSLKQLSHSLTQAPLMYLMMEQQKSVQDFKQQEFKRTIEQDTLRSQQFDKTLLFNENKESLDAILEIYKAHSAEDPEGAIKAFSKGVTSLGGSLGESLIPFLQPQTEMAVGRKSLMDIKEDIGENYMTADADQWDTWGTELSTIGGRSATDFLLGGFRTMRQQTPYYRQQTTNQNIASKQAIIEMIQDRQEDARAIPFARFSAQANIDAGVYKGEPSEFGSFSVEGLNDIEKEAELNKRIQELENKRLRELQEEILVLSGVESAEDYTPPPPPPPTPTPTPTPTKVIGAPPTPVLRSSNEFQALSSVDKNKITHLEQRVVAKRGQTKGMGNRERQMEEYRSLLKELFMAKLEHGFIEKPDAIPQDDWDKSTLESKISYFKSTGEL